MKKDNTNILNNDSGGVRTRVAPSPTGPMHIATARVALYNYLFAKQNNGKFILRIEDTDKERSKQEWTDEIISDLKWLGTNWDEGPDIGGEFGPYKQSQKSDVYEKYIKQLLVENKAYYCFCSEEELEAKRQDQMARGLAPMYDGKCSKLSSSEVEKKLANGEKSVIRFKVAKKKVGFKDIISGEVEFDMALLGDIVIAKDLKTALFHFTVVVDDYEMKISHVIRGDDHLSNTARQILIQEALGFPRPIYAHSPMILNSDRSKMSKRKNDVALASYIKKGYLPEAIINFIAFLGWNPGGEREIFSMHELEKEFKLEKVQKAGAIFNIQKLDNINGYYIRSKSIEKLTELCIPYLQEAGFDLSQFTKTKLQEIIGAYKDRLKVIFEIVELADFFFKDKLDYDKKMFSWKDMKHEDIKQALLLCDKLFEQIDGGVGEWTITKMQEVLFPEILKFNQEKNYPENNKGFVMWPLRVALSAKQASASPFEIAVILGKEKTLQRIKDAINIL